SAVLVVSIVPFRLTTPPTPVVVSPPVYVCVPRDCPRFSVPVLAKLTALVIAPPLPVEAKFTTLAPTTSAVALTAPLNVAVPPMFCTVSVPTPLVEVAVMFAAIPNPVSSVRLKVAPVTAPTAIVPATVVALVFSTVLAPNVMAPSTSAVLVVLIVPFSVTTPPTPVVVSPPVYVCVPRDCPRLSVPVLAKLTALVIAPPLPVEAKFTTLAPTLNAVALTAPLNVAVPPMVCTVNVPTPLVELAVMFAAIPNPVSSVRLNPAPVTAPTAIVPAAVVALVFSTVLAPSVMAPSTSAVLVVSIVPLTVTVPPTALVLSPP